MTNQFSIGGVNIYVPKSKENNEEYFKILPKEGDKYVIQYNGITIKFPEQENIKIGDSERPPHVCIYDDSTEIMLKNAEIYGSPNNDKVRSYCISSIFDFKDGGVDRIAHYKYNDENYTDIEKNSRFNINGDDRVVEYHQTYDEFSKKPNGEWIFRRTANDTKVDYRLYND